MFISFEVESIFNICLGGFCIFTSFNEGFLLPNFTHSINIIGLKICSTSKICETWSYKRSLQENTAKEMG